MNLKQANQALLAVSKETDSIKVQKAEIQNVVNEINQKKTEIETAKPSEKGVLKKEVAQLNTTLITKKNASLDIVTDAQYKAVKACMLTNASFAQGAQGIQVIFHR